MIRRLKKIAKTIIIKIRFGNKIRIGNNCDISPKSTFEGFNKVHNNVIFKGHLGFGSYIANNCTLTARIGRFCSIAPYVTNTTWKHPYTYPFVTSSPLFFSKSKYQCGNTFATVQRFEDTSCINDSLLLGCEIGNDVWIGQNVFIVGGVHICDGAVILAGAVVTKDIPPYAVVGGVPAKVLKYRYSEEDVKFLLKIKWWKNSEEWFKDHWELLNNIDMLKQYYASK